MILHKQSRLNKENLKSLQNILLLCFPNMSTERTSKKRARPEDDCIEFINREDIIDIEKLTSADDTDTNDEIEHAKTRLTKFLIKKKLIH